MEREQATAGKSRKPDDFRLRQWIAAIESVLGIRSEVLEQVRQTDPEVLGQPDEGR